MAIESIASGTQSAVPGTEHTLTTQIDAGVYVLVVDTSNMVDGDIVTFRIKTKYATGGTSRLAFLATYAHAQGKPNKYSVPIPVDTEIICTLEQEDPFADDSSAAGGDSSGADTGKDFYWNLLKI
jgi:hypothetical protein